MKFYSVRYLIFCLTIALGSCLTQEEKDEKIAKQSCAGCHAFPSPSLLPKATWEKSVLPQMAFRMGLDISELLTFSSADRPRVAQTLPSSQMVTDDQWLAIKRYYAANSPDSLDAPLVKIADTLKGFAVEVVASPTFPLNTFVTSDSSSGSLYVGSRSGKIYKLGADLRATDSIQLASPPAQIRVLSKDKMQVLLMGIMDPNDQAMGSFGVIEDGVLKTIIDSLKRPVYFQEVDLDNDSLNDIVICGFGNFSGALSAFRNKGDGTYERIDLVSLPGARKVIARDFDNNGLIDILALMSQGDEKVVLLLNQGSFNFRVNTLLSFPPVYGSSYFDLVDLNLDGKLDILYTNGDNADYSSLLKPYHGVRAYLNNGKNEFTESWFYNMHGASMAIANDFDKDGDVDIAAIAFFPPFKVYPEQGFIYFENTGSGYLPRVNKLGSAGRWLTMIDADIDKDGDTDIVLSALDFNSGIPRDLLSRWKFERTSLLVLRNRLNKEK